MSVVRRGVSTFLAFFRSWPGILPNLICKGGGEERRGGGEEGRRGEGEEEGRGGGGEGRRGGGEGEVGTERGEGNGECWERVERREGRGCGRFGGKK